MKNSPKANTSKTLNAVLVFSILALVTSSCAKEVVVPNSGHDFTDAQVADTVEDLSSGARCYEVDSEATDDSGQEIFDGYDSTSSTWCYYDGDASSMVSESLRVSDNATYIFNGDGSGIDGGLFAIIERDHWGEPTRLIHGSRQRGELSFHQTDLNGPNPIPAPIDENRLDRRNRSHSIRFSRGIARNFLELRQKARILSRSQEATPGLYAINEGTFSSTLEESKNPWKANYWPFGSFTKGGSNSPLGKFDKFIKEVTGLPGKASQWENKNNPKSEVGGYCNGWAAASILYPEPKPEFYNSVLDENLDIKTRKAVLIASSFCVHWAFYGKRMYLSSSADEQKDIDPVLFHKVIMYYLKKLKKAVALDYFSNYWVDNNVATGYEYTAKPVDSE